MTRDLKLVPGKANIGSCFDQLGSEFKVLMKGSNSSLPKEIISSILRGKSLC